MADKLDLPISRVGVWFQNRRSKEKRLQDEVLIKKYLGKDSLLKFGKGPKEVYKPNRNSLEVNRTELASTSEIGRTRVTGNSTSQKASGVNGTRVSVICATTDGGSKISQLTDEEVMEMARNLASANAQKQEKELPKKYSLRSSVTKRKGHDENVSDAPNRGRGAGQPDKNVGQLYTLCRNILTESDGMMSSAKLWNASSTPRLTIDSANGLLHQAAAAMGGEVKTF